ncbi:hypothetical protein ACFVAQ_24350 [Streptomyces sp. NPDC057651]|uniref:hypothetical protein n=1 Tax=Streptomyces sp. NPDC057651 TaxID=3346194 RepID=UPI0036B4A6A7
MGRHGWNSGAGWWRLTALLGVGVAALALVLTVISTLPDDRADDRGTTSAGDKVHGSPSDPPAGLGPPVGWGFTHTQYSADEGDDGATRRVEDMLSGQAVPQIQPWVRGGRRR